MLFCSPSGTTLWHPTIFPWTPLEGYVHSIDLKPGHIIEYFIGGKSPHEAHVNEQLLTEAQEEILVNWVEVQGRRGVPMTYSSVALCAGVISGKQISASWPKPFCKHHPDLKMKKTVGLEKARAKALNETAVKEFFDMIVDVIKEYNILPENMYNMDEKVFSLALVRGLLL
jgi:hypothetical protein